ncbi:MAG: [protein-PII] uridylyltransferase [Pseudomonadota bacterium]
MDTYEPLSVAPIEPEALEARLTLLFHQAGGDATKARPQVLSLIKQLNADARTFAEEDLMRTGDGRACAAFLSETMDRLIAGLYGYACAHIYQPASDGTTERVAVIATGGYGRGLLAPGSDIDLLFLLPHKKCPWAESIAEFILYLLWDMGLKVGHATRSIDQCIKLSATDMTIRSALVDSRFVVGDWQLSREYNEAFWADVSKQSARAFVDAKMKERESRHVRAGRSRFLVEPNIKDGKGGLRDLHTLHWLAKYLTGNEPGTDAVEKGVFLKSEMTTFRRCEDFLWTVRCHLHFLTGRAEERLAFEYQREMAERLGYREAKGLQAVERFMKHYFLIAKDVGDLTRTVATALEFQQLKATPRLDELFNPVNWVTRRRVRQTTEFRIENGRVEPVDPDLFKRDPLAMFRIFKTANETGSLFHPEAFRAIGRALRLVTDDVRRAPEPASIFMELLSEAKAAEAILSRMHSAGLLAAYMPEFRTVTSMMQFNMYHHYTVDEHLLKTVGELKAIEAGQTQDELPLSTEIFPTIKNRRALYLAALIHDIGKGRPEDHSLLGARLAQTICERLLLDDAETELGVWLVREHLTMSNVSQSRDLSDPKTIEDFAAIVETTEQLKLLLLLTVADIRAVGPGTWNGWKGALLRELYYSTSRVLRPDDSDADDSVAAAKAQLRAVLEAWDDEAFAAYAARHYPDYWGRTDLATQGAHAELIQSIANRKDRIGTTFKTDAFTEMTELMVAAPNHARLLSLFAGCCAAAGANIMGAQIVTMRDGLVIDTFQLKRDFDDAEDETRRTERIATMIRRVLRGEVRLADLLAARTGRQQTRMAAFDVTPEVAFANKLSDQYTVLEVSGRDRPGLLYDLTTALADLSIDIQSAHITTFGERARDVFYITDLLGKKITSPDRQAVIATAVTAVLDEAEGDPPAAPAPGIPATSDV